MEDSNVNNLNGVPNFGHGVPEGVPAEQIIPEAGAPEGVEIVEPVVEPAPEETKDEQVVVPEVDLSAEVTE